MANLKPVYASNVTIISGNLNSLANGSGALGNGPFDNSANLFLDSRITADVAASGAATGYVELYLMEGFESTRLSTNAIKQNMRYVGSIGLNGTTAVRKSFFVDNMPKFYNLYVVNNSGASLASSNNRVDIVGVNYENA